MKTSFKIESTPTHMMNLLGVPLLSINDPAMAQEVFTTKNKFVDKTGDFQLIFEDHAPDSFVFEKGTEHWKRKR